MKRVDWESMARARGEWKVAEVASPFTRDAAPVPARVDSTQMGGLVEGEVVPGAPHAAGQVQGVGGEKPPAQLYPMGHREKTSVGLPARQAEPGGEEQGVGAAAPPRGQKEPAGQSWPVEVGLPGGQ